jgi:hypothetical protein
MSSGNSFRVSDQSGIFSASAPQYAAFIERSDNS